MLMKNVFLFGCCFTLCNVRYYVITYQDSYMNFLFYSDTLEFKDCIAAPVCNKGLSFQVIEKLKLYLFWSFWHNGHICFYSWPWKLYLIIFPPSVPFIPLTKAGYDVLMCCKRCFILSQCINRDCVESRRCFRPIVNELIWILTWTPPPPPPPALLICCFSNYLM